MTKTPGSIPQAGAKDQNLGLLYKMFVFSTFLP